MSTTDDTNAARRGSESNDQLGLEPERAAFETWKRKQGGHYMSRNNAPGSDLSGYQDAHTQGQWEAWQAAVAAERERWRDELAYAEAALADIGDADREPGDDMAWCEARAAQALPRVRAALKA